ncbi:MAG: DHH family phosphoesterase [Planctomycetota bacterium]
MENILKEIKTRIESCSNCVITAHDRPDGDAIGATLGLHRVLKNLGCHTHITGCQPLPDNYRFMLEGDVFLSLEESWINDRAIMIILDCGNSDRAEYADIWRDKGGFTINIDHHKSNSAYGNINFIDPSASSTSELIVRLSRFNNWEISSSAANPLYGGILTDTGRFTFENTSHSALEAAAHLVSCGADPALVGENLYRSISKESTFLTARAMHSLQLEKNGKIAHVSLSRKDYLETACQPQDSGEIVDIAKNIKGVILSFFFYETSNKNETKISIRASEPVNAINLAERFGGGGHPRAAGCSIQEPLDRAREIILTEVDKLWQL